MEGKVFASKEFKEYANQQLVLLKFKLPSRGNAASGELARVTAQHNVNSIPRCILLSADGSVLHDTVGFRNAPDLIRTYSGVAN